MKKILLLVVIAFAVNISSAQKGSGERVKAFKIAYITEQLDLNSKEAQEFWPIYNKYQEATKKLRKEERQSLKALKETSTYESLTEKEAEGFISSYLDIEDQKSQLKKTLIKELKSVIPQKKILQLLKAEMDFKKRLLKQLRNRTKN